MWHFPHFTPNHTPDWDTLTARFNWLADMAAVPQDPEWHGEGDVLTHTKMVADALFRLPEYQALDAQAQHILFASALLHDVEKRSTTTSEERDGRIRIVSPRHAKKGEHTARQILYCDLAAPFAVHQVVAKLVRWHGLPLWVIEKPQPEHAVIAAALQTNTQWLAILAKADALGRICPDTAELLDKIALFQALCKENQSWGASYTFSGSHARYHYLNHPESSPSYQPYDDFSCTVHMMSALPGSGKDTHITRHFPDLPVLSLDDIRRAHRIDPADKKAAGHVIQIAKEQARQYLRDQQDFVFNATNLTRELRGKWTQLFADYRARICISYLEVPWQQLLRQNKQREHSVPEAVIRRLLGKLAIPFYDEAHEVAYHIVEAD